MPGWEYGVPVRVEAVGNVDFKVSRRPGRVATGGIFLRGYATRYNRPHVFNGGIDVFAPGVFAKSLLDGSQVRFLNNHDESALVAAVGAGLTLKSDDVGLSFELALPNTAEAARLLDEVDQGEKSQMSVGYDCLKYRLDLIAGHEVRIITQARLLEISAVRKGACTETYIERATDLLSIRLTKTEADAAAALNDFLAIHRQLVAAVGGAA